jgi:hypothetical protein
MKVREITTASAGDQYYFAGAFAALKHGDATPAFSGFDGAQQPRGSRAQDNCVKFADHFVLTSAQPSLSEMIIAFRALARIPNSRRCAAEGSAGAIQWQPGRFKVDIRAQRTYRFAQQGS